MPALPEQFCPDQVPPLVPQGAHPNLALAIELAEQGAFVFPCQAAGPSRKQPHKGVYWRNVSTDDVEQVAKLWVNHPDAVPGIDLAKSNFLVIDCDRKLSDGIAWFTAQAERHSHTLDGPQASTPSGGRHFYFTNPTRHGNSRGSLPPKQEADIDVRGAGGFVIAPGAVFTDGGTYSQPTTSIFNAVPPPAWLLNLLAPRQREAVSFVVPAAPHSDDRRAAYGNTAIEELARELASTPKGNRNNEANRLAFKAGQLVGGQCLTEAEAYEMLSAAALSWGISPRDKAMGPKGTIARSIAAGVKAPRGPADDYAPPVHIALNGVAPSKPDTKSNELPPHLLDPPGLVGQIARYITETALYPQPGLALGAALTIVGTAAGRHIAGPHKCGTHLYVVALAPSGAGKNHPLSMIATILDAAAMRQHIGPSQFISMPAVINFLCRSPLSVCAMDEFGAFLKRINNRRASGFEGAISGLLRTAWGSSFSAMTTPEWAQRAAETIFSPAMSIYGVSTAREFYDSLEGGDVTNGVLNRFLIIETKKRPPEQIPSVEPIPQQIIDRLKAIYESSGPLSMLCQSAKAPAYTTLAMTKEAEQVRRNLVSNLQQRGDADPTLEPFLARTAENALRLATIVTVGQGLDEIDQQSMEWGRDFALWSSDQLAEGAGLYIADSDTQATANAVRRAIQEHGGRVKRRDLIRALAHRYKRRELDDVIASLAESETVIIEKVEASEKGGRPSFFYSLGD